MSRPPIVLVTTFVLAICPGWAFAGFREEGSVTKVLFGSLAYYNATGITVQSGGQNYLYVYAQGVNPECKAALGGTGGDVIDLHRAPLQADGTPGAFTKVGRISPCAVFPGTHSYCLHGPPCFASFGPGQVFRATVNGQLAYQLLVEVSDWTNFIHYWRGYSPDGLNWTWEVTGQSNCPTGATCPDPVTPGVPPGESVRTITWKGVAQPLLSIEPSLNTKILNPVMLATYAGTNNAEWWGYLKYHNPTGWVTTPMRITWANGVPAVHLLRSTTQPFQYDPVPNNRITSLSQLKPLLVGFRAKTLLYDPGIAAYQLWGDEYVDGIWRQWVNCDVNAAPAPGAESYFDTHTKHWKQGTTFSWYDVTRFTMGAKSSLGSLSRYMPSGYAQAREFPFRWNSPSGRRFLFSATSDNLVCSPNPAHSYTVKSELVLYLRR